MSTGCGAHVLFSIRSLTTALRSLNADAEEGSFPQQVGTLFGSSCQRLATRLSQALLVYVNLTHGSPSFPQVFERSVPQHSQPSRDPLCPGTILSQAAAESTALQQPGIRRVPFSRLRAPVQLCAEAATAQRNSAD